MPPRQSTAPKLLLLTPIAAGDSGVGAIYLRDLCQFYPAEIVTCIVGEHPPSDGYRPALYLPWWAVFADARGHRGRIGKILSRIPGGKFFTGLIAALAWKAVRRLCIPHMVQEVLRLASQRNCEEIWTVVEGPLPMFLTQALLDQGQKVRMTVWDPPGTWLKHMGYDPSTVDETTRCLHDCIPRVASCGVPSPDMKARFDALHKIESVSLIHGVHPAWRFPSKPPGLATPIVIGFAGCMRCPDEWLALLRALDECHWKIDGKAVELRFLGRYPEELPRPSGLTLYGHVSVARAAEVLSECTLAYLPYWFAEDQKELVQYAFPNKISTYVAAGIPTFFHGPDYSSVPKFLEIHAVGASCYSTSHEAILACLRSMLAKSATTGWGAAIDRAYDQALGLASFRESFAKFLQLEPSQLLPIEKLP